MHDHIILYIYTESKFDGISLQWENTVQIVQIIAVTKWVVISEAQWYQRESFNLYDPIVQWQ